MRKLYSWFGKEIYSLFKGLSLALVFAFVVVCEAFGVHLTMGGYNNSEVFAVRSTKIAEGIFYFAAEGGRNWATYYYLCDADKGGERQKNVVYDNDLSMESPLFRVEDGRIFGIDYRRPMYVYYRENQWHLVEVCRVPDECTQEQQNAKVDEILDKIKDKAQVSGGFTLCNEATPGYYQGQSWGNVCTMSYVDNRCGMVYLSGAYKCSGWLDNYYIRDDVSKIVKPYIDETLSPYMSMDNNGLITTNGGKQGNDPIYIYCKNNQLVLTAKDPCPKVEAEYVSGNAACGSVKFRPKLYVNPDVKQWRWEAYKTNGNWYRWDVVSNNWEATIDNILTFNITQVRVAYTTDWNNWVYSDPVKIPQGGLEFTSTYNTPSLRHLVTGAELEVTKTQALCCNNYKATVRAKSGNWNGWAYLSQVDGYEFWNAADATAGNTDHYFKDKSGVDQHYHEILAINSSLKDNNGEATFYYYVDEERKRIYYNSSKASEPTIIVGIDIDLNSIAKFPCEPIKFNIPTKDCYYDNDKNFQWIADNNKIINGAIGKKFELTAELFDSLGRPNYIGVQVKDNNGTHKVTRGDYLHWRFNTGISSNGFSSFKALPVCCDEYGNKHYSVTYTGTGTISVSGKNNIDADTDNSGGKYTVSADKKTVNVTGGSELFVYVKGNDAYWSVNPPEPEVVLIHDVCDPCKEAKLIAQLSGVSETVLNSFGDQKPKFKWYGSNDNKTWTLIPSDGSNELKGDVFGQYKHFKLTFMFGCKDAEKKFSMSDCPAYPSVTIGGTLNKCDAAKLTLSADLGGLSCAYTLELQESNDNKTWYKYKDMTLPASGVDIDKVNSKYYRVAVKLATGKEIYSNTLTAKEVSGVTITADYPRDKVYGVNAGQTSEVVITATSNINDDRGHWEKWNDATKTWEDAEGKPGVSGANTQQLRYTISSNSEVLKFRYISDKVCQTSNEVEIGIDKIDVNCALEGSVHISFNGQGGLGEFNAITSDVQPYMFIHPHDSRCFTDFPPGMHSADTYMNPVDKKNTYLGIRQCGRLNNPSFPKFNAQLNGDNVYMIANRNKLATLNIGPSQLLLPPTYSDNDMYYIWRHGGQKYVPQGQCPDGSIPRGTSIPQIYPLLGIQYPSEIAQGATGKISLRFWYIGPDENDNQKGVYFGFFSDRHGSTDDQGLNPENPFVAANCVLKFEGDEDTPSQSWNMEINNCLMANSNANDCLIHKYVENAKSGWYTITAEFKMGGFITANQCPVFYPMILPESYNTAVCVSYLVTEMKEEAGQEVQKLPLRPVICVSTESACKGDAISLFVKNLNNIRDHVDELEIKWFNELTGEQIGRTLTIDDIATNIGSVDGGVARLDTYFPDIDVNHITYRCEITMTGEDEVTGEIKTSVFSNSVIVVRDPKCSSCVNIGTDIDNVVYTKNNAIRVQATFIDLPVGVTYEWQWSAKRYNPDKNWVAIPVTGDGAKAEVLNGGTVLNFTKLTAQDLIDHPYIRVILKQGNDIYCVSNAIKMTPAPSECSWKLEGVTTINPVEREVPYGAKFRLVFNITNNDEWTDKAPEFTLRDIQSNDAKTITCTDKDKDGNWYYEFSALSDYEIQITDFCVNSDLITVRNIKQCKSADGSVTRVWYDDFGKFSEHNDSKRYPSFSVNESSGIYNIYDPWKVYPDLAYRKYTRQIEIGGELTTDPKYYYTQNAFDDVFAEDKTGAITSAVGYAGTSTGSSPANFDNCWNNCGIARHIRDGNYAIVYNAMMGSCMNWGVYTGDHTKNGNGGMLFINMPPEGGLVYKAPFVSVCEDAVATISCYVSNANQQPTSVPCSVTLRVTGTEGTNSYRSGNIVARKTTEKAAYQNNPWTHLTFQVKLSPDDATRANKKPGDKGYTYYFEIVSDPATSNQGNDLLFDDIEIFICNPDVAISSEDKVTHEQEIDLCDPNLDNTRVYAVPEVPFNNFFTNLEDVVVVWQEWDGGDDNANGEWKTVYKSDKNQGSVKKDNPALGEDEYLFFYPLTVVGDYRLRVVVSTSGYINNIMTEIEPYKNKLDPGDKWPAVSCDRLYAHSNDFWVHVHESTKTDTIKLSACPNDEVILEHTLPKDYKYEFFDGAGNLIESGVTTTDDETVSQKIYKNSVFETFTLVATPGYYQTDADRRICPRTTVYELSVPQTLSIECVDNAVSLECMSNYKDGVDIKVIQPSLPFCVPNAVVKMELSQVTKNGTEFNKDRVEKQGTDWYLKNLTASERGEYVLDWQAYAVKTDADGNIILDSNGNEERIELPDVGLGNVVKSCVVKFDAYPDPKISVTDPDAVCPFKNDLTVDTELKDKYDTHKSKHDDYQAYLNFTTPKDINLLKASDDATLYHMKEVAGFVWRKFKNLDRDNNYIYSQYYNQSLNIDKGLVFAENVSSTDAANTTTVQGIIHGAFLTYDIFVKVEKLGEGADGTPVYEVLVSSRNAAHQGDFKGYDYYPSVRFVSGDIEPDLVGGYTSLNTYYEGGDVDSKTSKPLVENSAFKTAMDVVMNDDSDAYTDLHEYAQDKYNRIEVEVSSGTSPYHIEFENAVNTGFMDSGDGKNGEALVTIADCSEKTDYKVIVTDAHGCKVEHDGALEFSKAEDLKVTYGAFKTGAKGSADDDRLVIEGADCKFLVPDLTKMDDYLTATTTCELGLTYTQSIASGSEFEGDTEVILTATNQCNQTATKTVYLTSNKVDLPDDGTLDKAECYGGDSEYVLTGWNSSRFSYKAYAPTVAWTKYVSGSAYTDEEATGVTSSVEGSNITFTLPYGNCYRIEVVDNENGCKKDYFINLDKLTAFDKGEIASTGQDICFGSTSVNTIGSTADATPSSNSTLSYKWQVSTNDVDYEDIAGADERTYKPAVTAVGKYYYKRFAKDSKCQTDWVESAGKWLLEIHELPALESITSPITVCKDAKANVSLSLQTKTIAPYEYAIGTTKQDSENFTLGAGSYTAKVTDKFGCVSAPINFTIDEYSAPTVKLSNKITSYCHGTATALPTPIITWSDANSGTPKREQGWYLDNEEFNGTDLTSLAVGSHKLEYRIKNECGSTALDDTEFEVFANPTPEISDGGKNLCAGGSLVLKTTKSYTSYEWNDGSDKSSITVSAAGTYTVTVTDGKGCKGTSEAYKVVSHDLPELDTPTVPKVCQGINASVTLSVTPNTSNSYTYTVNNTTTPADYSKTQKIATFTDLGVGSYSATVTDEFGCVSVAKEFSVGEYGAPTVTLSNEISSFCHGTATALPTPSITWSDAGESNPTKREQGWYLDGKKFDKDDLSSLTAKNETYTLEYRIKNECSSTAFANTTFKVYALPTVTLSAIDKSCNADITFTAVADNGAEPYSYKWDNESTFGSTSTKTFEASTLTDSETSKSESHKVQVSDNNGCISSVSEKKTATIYKNPVLGDFTNPTDLCPNLTSYNVVANLVGGYKDGTNTYSWTGATSKNNDENATINNTGEKCGDTYNYSVTVTNSTSGCSDTKPGSFTTSASAPKLAENIAAITLEDGVNCEFAIPFNAIKTAANYSSSCGIAAKTWEFKIGENVVDENTKITANSTVKITVTDECGKTASASVELKVPSAPTIPTWKTDKYTICNSENSTAALTLVVSGGTSPYTYKIGEETSVPMTGNTATINKKAGTYTVTVTDKNGCSVTSGAVTISNYANPEITLEPELTPICAGTEGVTLPTPSIKWNDGYTTGTTTRTQGWYHGDNQVTSAYIKTLEANSYTFIYKVKNECGITEELTKTFTVNALPTVSISNGGKYLCEKGSLVLQATENAGYEYLWNNANATKTSSITVTTAGTYTVTVTDGNSCVGSASYKVEEHSLPVLNTIDNQTVCQGATTNVSLSVTPTTSNPYSYTVDKTSVTPVVTTTQKTNDFTLGAGSYTAKVTDKFGCVSEGKSFTISEYTWTDATLVAKEQTLCKENLKTDLNEITVNATANGSATDLTYTWTLAADDEATVPTGSTFKPTVSEAGTYVYKVTVNDACTKGSTDLTYTLKINSAPEIGDLTAPANICSGGSFSLTTPTVTDNGKTTTSMWEVKDGDTWKSFTNSSLEKDEYILRYASTNACGTTYKESVTGNVDKPSAITISPATSTVCTGTQPVLTVGEIVGEIQSIKAGETVLDKNDYVYSGNTITLPEISEKTVYSIEVKSGECSIANATATVDVYDNPTIDDLTLTPICAGTENVILPTPSVEWSDPNAGISTRTAGWYYGTTLVTSDDIKKLAANTSGYEFIYKVKNECGSTAELPKTFTVYANPTLATIPSKTLCYDETTTISATPGFKNYTWTKDGEIYVVNSSSITTANENKAVVYTVVATDNNDCVSNTVSFTVTQPTSNIYLDKESVTQPSVVGATDASYSFDIEGGYGEYKYCLKADKNDDCTPLTSYTGTISQSNVGEGTYYYNVVDKYGCKNVLDITIPSSSSPSYTVKTTDALCYNSATGTITIESEVGAFIIKVLDNLGTEISSIESNVVSGKDVVVLSNLTADKYSLKYIYKAVPTITEKFNIEISEPAAAVSFDLAFATDGVSTPCDVNFKKVVLSNATGGTPYTTAPDGKDYYNGYVVTSNIAASDIESFADGKYILKNNIESATVTIEDAKGCQVSQTIAYVPKDADLHITCENFKGIVKPFDANCELNISGISPEDTVGARLCSPDEEIIVKYSLDNISFKDLPFDETLTVAEPTKTIYWQFSTNYPGINAKVCEQTIKAIDNLSPEFSSKKIDHTISYTSQGKNCNASYTNNKVDTLLGITDCSLKEVTYCLRKKGETTCLATGKVFENGVYGSINTGDLTHGEYEIVYSATDGVNPSVSKTQSITIVDDVAPTIACLPDYELSVKYPTCKVTETVAVDSIYEKYAVANSLVTKNTDGTYSIVGNNDRVVLGTDGKTITSIKDECGVTLKVESSLNNTTFDDSKKSFTLGLGEKQEIYWTLSDGVNKSTCTTTVTAKDKDKPVVQTPETLVINTSSSADKCKGSATITNADILKALDVKDCSGYKINYKVDGGTSVELGSNNIVLNDMDMPSHEITYEVVDEAGNVTIVKQQVQVVDDVAPEIVCPTESNIFVQPENNCEATTTVSKEVILYEYANKNNLVSKNDDGKYSIVGNNDRVTLSADGKTITSVKDECGVTLKVESSLDNTTFDDRDKSFTLGLGQSQEIHWTLSDGKNNTSCTSKITAIDTTSPKVTKPTEITIHTSSSANKCLGDTTLENQFIKDALAIKECSPYTIEYSIDGKTSVALGDNDLQLENLEPGDHTVSFIVTDAEGKETVVTQKVTVKDNVAPEIKCLADYDIFVKGDDCKATEVVSKDSIFEQYVLQNGLAIKNADGTFTVKDANRFTLSTDGKTITSIKDECGVTLKVESSIDNTTFDANNKSFTLGLGEKQEIYWTLSDGVNENSCKTTVTAKDTTRPEIVETLEKVTLPARENSCDANWSLTESDIIAMLQPKDCSNTEISYKVKDSEGNYIKDENGKDKIFKVTENNVLTLQDGQTIEWIVSDGNKSNSVDQDVEVKDMTDPVVDCNKLTPNINVKPEDLAGVKCIDSVFLKNNGLLTLENIGSKKQYIKDNCSAFEEIIKTPTRYYENTVEPMDSPFKVGTTEIQWTIVDKSGNANSFCTQSITIPNIAPEIACPDTVIELPVDYGNSCLGTSSTKSEDMVVMFRKPVLAAQGITESSAEYDKLLRYGDCGSKLSVDSELNGDSVRVVLGETKTITYTIKDENGNSTTCRVTYKGVDKASPELTKNPIVTPVERDEDCTAKYKPTLEEIKQLLEIKDCSQKLTIQYQVNGGELVTVNSNGAKIDFSKLSGDNTITWHVSDGVNKVSTKDQTVTIVDNTPPDYVCPSEPVKVYVGDDCRNSDVISSKQMLINLRGDAVLTPNGKTHWGITEEFLTSQDMEKISHDCADTVIVKVKDGNTFKEFDKININLGLGESQSFEFEVSDKNGNAYESCVVTFVAVDTTAPKADKLNDFLVYLPKDKCGVDYEATLGMMKDSLNPADNCTSNPEISYVSGNDTIALTDTESFKIEDLKAGNSQEITWVVKDASGNKVIRKQTITAKDTVAPAVDCSKYQTLTYVVKEHDKTVSVDDFRNLNGYAIEDDFNDMCDGLLNPSVERLDGKNFVGDLYDLDSDTDIKITFTDKSGNSSSCTINLVVIDSVHPEIICPADYDKTLACTNDFRIPSYLPKNVAEFKQYVGGKILTERNIVDFKVDESMEGDKCLGAKLFTYTIYDRFGDSSKCVNRFEIKDTVKPTWTNRLVDEFPVITCSDELNDSMLPANLSAADNCGGATVKYIYENSQSSNPEECSHYNYEHIYTYFATDECGNTSADSIEFKIIVRDTEAPKFKLEDYFVDSVISVGFKKNCIFEMIDITAFAYDLSDNCADVSVLKMTQTPAAGTQLDGSLDAVITLTDVCGNVSAYTKPVMVPTRQSIVNITSNDFAMCSDVDNKLNILSNSVIKVDGSYKYYDDYTKEFIEIISLFSYDVFKEQIDDENVIYSNNSYKPYYNKFYSPDKNVRDSIKFAAIHLFNSGQSGTYYVIATDTLTGCSDTASFNIAIYDKPRVAMTSDTVESCENLSIPIHSAAGDYMDIYHVCVEDMGQPITNSGWMLNGEVYEDRKLTFADDGKNLVYFAENVCGRTRSDSSMLWSCDYSYNIADGSFVSDTTLSALLNDTSSNALTLSIREQIVTQNIILSSNPNDKSRVWIDEPVDLKVSTHYNDNIEFLWYKVNGEFDAVSGKFDGYGNILESYLSPLDERDELIGVSHSYEEFYNTLHVPVIQDTSMFYVVVTDNICSSAASNLVQIDAYDFIPTAFTPHNSIGMNDVFMKGFKVEIFNRYGSKVFTGDDGWDGTIRGELADPTVYYYIVSKGDYVRKGTIEVVCFK